MGKRPVKQNILGSWIKRLTLSAYSKCMRIIALSLILLTVIGCVESLPYVWKWVNRPISVVKVEGRFHYLSQQQLKKKLSAIVSVNFFSLKLSVVQKVLLSIPWVSHAEIRKTWPGTLWVKVYEKTPVARWNKGSLIDESGNIFQPGSIADFQKLPLLQGSEQSAKEAWKDFNSLRQRLSDLPVKVTGFQLDNNGSWICMLGSIPVFLGIEQHNLRLRALNILYNQILKNKWSLVARIDLRYPDGAAVAWKKSK